MKYIFNGCESLEFLPDISKWNTEKVNDFSNMFNKCKSLLAIPDISKWNTSQGNNMMFMFSECKLLSKLPDLSKWDTFKVTNFRYMFNGCESLTSLPDISIWENSERTRYINKCISLSFLFSFKISAYMKTTINSYNFLENVNIIRPSSNCINCTNMDYLI